MRMLDDDYYVFLLYFGCVKGFIFLGSTKCNARFLPLVTKTQSIENVYDQRQNITPLICIDGVRGKSASNRWRCCVYMHRLIRAMQSNEIDEKLSLIFLMLFILLT